MNWIQRKSSATCFFVIALTSVTFASSCTSKKSKGSNRSGAQPAAANPDQGSGPTTGLSVSESMIVAISNGLTDAGIPPADITAVVASVNISPGVLAIGMEPELALADDHSPIEKAATPIARAYIDAISKISMDDERTQIFLKTVIESSLNFVGESTMPSERRGDLVGDISASGINGLADSGIAPEKLADAMGTISRATMFKMLVAKVPAAEAETAATAVSSKIATAAGGLSLSDEVLGNAIFAIGKSASEGSLAWSVTDPVGPASAVTQGLLDGLAASKTTLDKRLLIVDRIPEGVNTALSKLVGQEELYQAVSTITDRTITAFMEKDGKDLESASLQTAVPSLIGGAVKGILKGGISEQVLSAQNLAAAPMDALIQNLDKGLGAAAADRAARVSIVTNSISSTMDRLSLNTEDPNLLAVIAPAAASKTLEMASGNLARMGMTTTAGNLDQDNITTLYQNIFQGAFNGLSSGSASVKILPNIVASTMDGAVKALGKLQEASATSSLLTSSMLSNIGGVASAAMASKFSKKLSPADLNVVFAAGTGQYLHGMQAMANARPTMGAASDLAAGISAQSLSTFTGYFNANATGIQDAANALSGKLGSNGVPMDSKVVASITGAVQGVVVNAAMNMNADVLKACATFLPDSDSTAQFEAALLASPNLAACTATALATPTCPVSRSGNMYQYRWNFDSTGVVCMLIREMVITGAGATTCASGERFIYGLGCQKSVVTCDADQKFVYGIGCQSSSFFCPMGQHFVDGVGCRAVTNTYACPVNSYYQPMNGCQPMTNNCAAGLKWSSATSSCTADSTAGTDLASGCPAEFKMSNTGTCTPINIATACPAGLNWNGTICVAAVATLQCPSGEVWNSSLSKCVQTANPVCPPNSGQFWNSTISACVCPTGKSWDPVAKICVAAVGSCSGGTVFNATLNQCLCPAGKFWNGTACESNPLSEQICVVGGGTWIQSSNTCRCPVGKIWRFDLNICKDDNGPRDACLAASGTWNLANTPPCACSAGNLWNPATNSCQSNSARETSCTSTGGTFAGDVCSCPANKPFDPVSNECKLCPAGAHSNGNQCVLDQCAPDQSWHTTLNKCVLKCADLNLPRWEPTSASCLSGGCIESKRWDREAKMCVLACGAGLKPLSATSTSCVANGCNENQRWHYGLNQCVLIIPPCGAGNHFNGNVCVPDNCGLKTWSVANNRCQ